MSDMEKEKITLLACPFCGGEAEIVRDWIRCIKCGVWTDVPKEEDGLPKSIQAWNTRAKQVDERQELDVDEVMDCIDQVYDCDHNGSGFVDNWRTVAQAIVNTFKPKVEKKSIKELQDKLVKFFSIESLTLNESTIVHLVAMISQHSYYADKPKVEVTEDEMKLNVRQSLLGHGKLHKKYWAEPTKTQEISYGRWRQDLAEGIVEHLIQLLKDKEGTQNDNT